MKAIITAAGLGTRSGLNGVIRKELLNVYDRREGSILLRPLIDVLIHRLTDIGIRDIAVVLDPGDKVAKTYIETVFPTVHFFYQKEKRGFGDAVLTAREFVGKEGFLVAAGDGMILDFSLMQKAIMELEKSGRWTIFVMKVEDPGRYGVAVLDVKEHHFSVNEVIEKPKNPQSDYAMCALYYLPPEIFQFFHYRDGYAELTEAIDNAIKAGIKFSAIEVPNDQWISVGRAETYISVLSKTYDNAKKGLIKESDR